MDLTYVSLILLNFVLVAITYTNPAAAQLSKSVLGDWNPENSATKSGCKFWLVEEQLRNNCCQL